MSGFEKDRRQAAFFNVKSGNPFFLDLLHCNMHEAGTASVFDIWDCVKRCRGSLDPVGQQMSRRPPGRF
jgi:hypothetical protein